MYNFEGLRKIYCYNAARYHGVLMHYRKKFTIICGTKIMYKSKIFVKNY